MKLSLREVVGEVGAAYRTHFWQLTGLAVIVFAPIALLEAVA